MPQRIPGRWLLKLPGGVAIVMRRASRDRQRALVAKIEEASVRSQPAFDAAGDDEVQQQGALADLMEECRPYDEELAALRWSELMGQAARFGIDVPGIAQPNAQSLNLQRQITEARFAFWKKW